MAYKSFPSKLICTIIFIFFSSISLAKKINNKSINWNDINGNSYHTGFVPITVDPNKIKFKWKKKDKGFRFYQFQPVVTDTNVIAIGTNDDREAIKVLSIKDGSLNWSKRFAKGFYILPPVFRNGNVYLQSSPNYIRDEKGKVEALDEATGKSVFQYKFNSHMLQPIFYAPILSNHISYFNTDGYGHIVAMNMDTGVKLWTSSFYADNFYQTHQLSTNKKYTIIKEGTTLYKINTSNGKIVSEIYDEIDFGRRRNSIPILDDESYAFYQSSRYLTKFNLDENKIDFRTPNTSSNSAIDESNIYVIQNGFLTIYEKQFGKLKWQGDIWESTDPDSQIIITNNLIFVSSLYGTTAYSKFKNHLALWHSEIYGNMALTNNGLFIIDKVGKLHAFSFN